MNLKKSCQKRNDKNEKSGKGIGVSVTTVGAIQPKQR